MQRMNMAEQLTTLFYMLRGEDQPYKKPRKRPDHSCYKPFVPYVRHITTRGMGTLGFQYSGKGARPASTYRGARRNAARGARYSHFWRDERNRAGLTRREMDRQRGEMRNVG